MRIADVQSNTEAPGTDGDVHVTTSVAFARGLVYVSAGSSCNATMAGGGKPCAEVDRTRASISAVKPDGSGVTLRAKRIRNAIALAVESADQVRFGSAMPAKTTCRLAILQIS